MRRLRPTPSCSGPRSGWPGSSDGGAVETRCGSSRFLGRHADGPIIVISGARLSDRSMIDGGNTTLNRDEFLANVGRAQTTATLPGSGPAGVFDWSDNAPIDLVARFSDRVQAVDGRVHRVVGREEGTDTLFQLLTDYHARQVLMWDAEHLPIPMPHGRLQRLGISLADPVLPVSIDERKRHQLELGRTTVGITGACGGLAESGSIVLQSGPGRSRLASLIPEVHIAVLRIADLFESLDQFLRAGRVGLDDQANLTLITGPSRTADIELTLTLGAHGPRHLHVLLMD